ncbi:hypothetical protein M0R45_006233 [Rubus argutus]|uniref:Uncharacterized protein n=1 Tax=Rubus argutus TaxID=59490 RepID=A0AAW1YQH4_RUBAR
MSEMAGIGNAQFVDFRRDRVTCPLLFRRLRRRWWPGNGRRRQGGRNWTSGVAGGGRRKFSRTLNGHNFFIRTPILAFRKPTNSVRRALQLP